MTIRKNLFMVLICMFVLISASLPIAATESADNFASEEFVEFDGNFNSDRVIDAGDGIFILLDQDGNVESYIVRGDSELNATLFGNENYDSEIMTASVWSVIAKFLVALAKKAGELVITSCIDGGNVCKALLQQRIYFTPPSHADISRLPVAYWSKYTSGKVPGCVPSHSGMCNTGYWEYKLTYNG